MNFKCKKCGCCCNGGIVILYPEDIISISAYLQITRIEFVNKYLQNANIFIDRNHSIDIYYLDNHTKCRFLTEKNLCLINSVKPLQCKLGPKSYFNSIGSWKNCVQLSHIDENPFEKESISDDFFIKKLLAGYII